VTKWFFDDDATPLAILLTRQLARTEMLNNGREETIRNGEIEQVIAARLFLLIQLAQVIAQVLIGGWIVEIAAQIRHPGDKPLPNLRIELLRVPAGIDEFLRHVAQCLVPVVGRDVGQIDTRDRKLLGQKLGAGEIV
jgi:hypothetical protein